MSFIFIASPRIVSGCCVVRGNRLHGLDLSTKHVADDSREPENEKGFHMAALFEYKLATLVILFTWR
ncbi:hypothetical protein R455_001322 [Salmonella enterica subsp. enterica]|nr:hypothetical protein [Salmonella enterica subsp. enterica serovar Wandsworth]EDT6627817.1 hypothetical protein [Salmonella enterica subsp. enterica serovar Wandsworth]EDT6697120.1 hypothetical protein [Salmonella enterica subsp. enterica serovar Wandsworth]EDT6704208.1 hypothetical protein [Salmonella enterica subsp. enterica serovar Wandsworth]EDT6710165.1 hypothetical protein [Salmonella enterica subsp. enterica serovar Wandsworth]